mgnify:FL=1
MNKNYEYVYNFQNMGFGMFVHFGLFSVIGKGEWSQDLEPFSVEDYEKYVDKFNPDKDWAKNLVALAKESGCKYITLTTRHHDGFSLFDTKGLNKYDSVHSPAKRDLVREFVNECNNAGISPFLYHTLLDWHNPDYKNNFPEYLKYLRESVKILCTQYGKIGGLWFDGLWDKDDDWQIDILYAMIRSFQPEAIIVNNQGISKSSRAAHKEVDVTTFERSNCEKLCDSSRPVVGEMCQVFGDHWGYAANDVNYKPFSTILNNFIDCRNNRCNFLLNTGLLPDGKVPLTDRAYFNAMGKWIKTNKNFVYNLKKTDITAEGAYIFFDGAHYYAVIKNVPMVANPNVQLKPEDIKKVKVSRPIKNAVWLDDGCPIDSTDGEFEVKTFKYGVSLCARVARFDI